jgi:L,D-transpeptidase ErfK/SrfK
VLRLIVGCIFLAAAAPRAAATTFPLSPDETTVGATASYVTRGDDSLMKIARSFDLGFTELRAANQGVDPWPEAGLRIVVPSRYVLPDAPRRGIVINLAAQRLYYFPPAGGAVESYPIGVGVEGRRTPLGETTVVGKVKNPTWYPPPSIRSERPELPAAVPPGPDNPLGANALRLGWPLVLIHGTNKPDGVGRSVSHGCLHLYPEDMKRLFAEVEVGTPVRVVNREVETAWIDQRLYLVVYRDVEQSLQLSITGGFAPRPPRDLDAEVAKAAGARRGSVDWQRVRRAGLERTGIPVPVTPAPQPEAGLTR